MSSDFDLVIFDCDGTLVDSETLNNLAVSEVLTGCGFDRYTPEYCTEKLVGMHLSKVWAYVEAETGKPLPDDILQRCMDRVAALRPGMIRPAPGVMAVVSALHAAARAQCVASNGEPENVRASVELAGFDPYFPPQTIFTASMVDRPKPEPDLFLYAARKMGAAPARTLVIEDSLSGAQAGLSAGMCVFGYYGLSHTPDQQAQLLQDLGVHHKAGDFGALARLLGV